MSMRQGCPHQPTRKPLNQCRHIAVVECWMDTALNCSCYLRHQAMKYHRQKDCRCQDGKED